MNRKKTIIYGAGNNFSDYYNWISDDKTIIWIVDNSASKTGKVVEGITVKESATLYSIDFDCVVITPVDYKEIEKELTDHGVPREKIIILEKEKIKYIENKITELSKNRFPQMIEIETINRCNGICPFCPVNINQPQRPYAKMTTELFDKIINELSNIQFNGKLSLFSNNEPFLDNRIELFIEKAKKKVPRAFINLYTNGTVLTLERLKKIIPYIDNLVIDNYNDDLSLNPNVEKINAFLKYADRKTNEKIHIWVRKQNEVLNSRGGNAPNKKGFENRLIDYKCLLPFEQFVIRPDGLVSLCCADALGEISIGDLNQCSIKEIWNSEEANNYRKIMMEKGRRGISICRNCDQLGGW